MTSLKAECRKFAPNIFNKSKCQNCFRGKDAHSSEALESNRATRKVSCCGYLFVAPDWDFSLPANRNKRWQRRWFVLYDDGELAYSVDEHPETVPQAVLDMNCVLEVADAENVTGNPFALAVTCPDKVHFIKGTSKEESKKWFEVLSKFPRNTVCGKYKRNATFPCIKSTPVVKIETPVSSLSSRRDTVDMSSSYAKHNGYVSRSKQSAGVAFDPGDDVFPTKDTNSSPLNTPQRTLVCEDKKKQEISTPLLNESNCLRSTLTDPVLDPKTYLKPHQDTRKAHSRSDVSRMHPSVEDKTSVEWRRSDLSRVLSSSSEEKSDWRRVEGGAFHNNPVYLMMADVPAGKKIENYENFFTRERPRMLRRQSSFGKKSDLQKQLLEWSEEGGEMRERTIHKSASVPNASLREDSKNGLLNGMAKDERMQLKSSLSQIRGDPDGCNLDSMPSYCASTSEFTTEQSNELMKKGWLVKQDANKWNKYWFVLRNSALTYFSDPIAEDAGILDGFLDLRKVSKATEVDSTSGHTFCVVMKDLSKLYLSAVTAKIRTNWIRAILQAANLKSEDPVRRKDKSPTEDCPTPTRALPEDSPEEQQRGNPLALPPSPPLARTAISRVKERAKTRSNSRTRSPKFATEVQESDPLGDSDDGTTDHSSSSLLNNNIGTTPLKEKKSPSPKESTPKDEKPSGSKPERRRSLKLESGSFQDGRKKVTDIKDKLEDSSWTIWLDISKFCKEVECKLDDLEEKSPSKGGAPLSGEQRREVGALVSSLGRVEDRLHRVHGELEKAKTTLLLRDSELGTPLGKVLGCSSLQREVSRLSGISSQNALLAQQLNGAREENRRLKAEVKKSQDSSDAFELACASLRQAGEQAEQLHRSHMRLMAERVDDLTAKLFASEKSVRQLRLRVAKLEQRQERRRSSLKGKEALTLSKEYEAKLTELEQKILAVEGTLLKGGEGGAQESKSQSLLGRLHSLDRKVKDVAETVAQEEEEVVDLPPKPKIRLQVNLNENSPQEDWNVNNLNKNTSQEDWNSLSLSTSMTDLTTADKDEACEEDSLSLSFADCLESLSHKVSSLVSWLKTSLQLLYAQGHMNPFQASKIDFIGGEASEELSKLVRALEFVTGKMEEPPVEPQGLSSVVGKLLYNIILLQEVSNVVFKMSDFEKYKAAVLVQHLNRVRQAIGGIEQYIEQKSNPVYSSVQKISLCNVVSCLLFYKSSLEEEVNVSDVNILFEEVDSKKKHISSVLAEFKEKFIERFCATIIELSEDSSCDKPSPQKSPDQKNDPKPLGQKQFLAHISHIISQVSQSFITHISKSLNEVYFLCASLQYGEKWTDYICKLLQQELSLLSSEIKSICVKHLENSFFSSSKCGVLVEYMHCSISELAQIVSIVTVVDGTVVLIKDALHSEGPASVAFSKDATSGSVTCSKEALSAFHESLQLRSAGALANLPGLRFSRSSPSPCGPSELGVAHRSVCSLLCFKRKWARGECRGCFELRQEVSYLQGELEESRAASCDRCRQGELAWRERVQEVVKEKDKQYEVEKEKLERELHMAQNNIKRLEHHYDEELRNLQHVYEQKLQQKNENIREDIKLRYSDEIEQLKCLCDRGLSAMEASHQQIVRELERRHQGELEDVLADRERALAEEAHATAIALEAVRKAHSEELQKQIQKFKDEFVLKMNKRFETEAFKKCYESDLSNVKCEILSMTEKYSVKCLENATLQEKLEIMNQQLKSTTTQVVELLAKNQQLQARLTSDTLQKQEESLI